MQLFGYLALALLLWGTLDLTSGSTRSFPMKTVEESINDLYDAIANVERRDRSDLAQRIKREIMVELADWAAKQREQTLAEGSAAVEERLLKEKNERSLMDDQILMQVQQLQRAERDTLEMVTNVKNEVASVSERGRIETDLLEVRIEEMEDLARSRLASQLDTEDAIRRNVSLSSAEVLKTLTNHTSEISSINTRLIRVENRCSDPPHVEYAHPIDGGFEGRADHEAVVTYACRGDKVPAGNDKMRCLYGKWTGEIPRCVDPVCGLDLRNVDVNGNGVVDGNSSSGAPSWPWMAAVYWKGESEIECAGSIIHRHFILTSAYCVHTHNDGWKQLVATDLTVRLGLTDTRVLTHLQEYNVRTIYVHPLFNTSKPFDYAIALLELEKPIDYGLFIRPVCLPPIETPGDNLFYEPQSSLHVIGWRRDGSNYTLSEYPNVIQPADTCKEKYEKIVGQNLPDTAFCASQSGGAGCPYTVGGSAAVQFRPDGRGGRVRTLVGVCVGCSSDASGSRLYSIFARLQRLVPWVVETVEGSASILG